MVTNLHSHPQELISNKNFTHHLVAGNSVDISFVYMVLATIEFMIILQDSGNFLLFLFDELYSRTSCTIQGFQFKDKKL